jgi:hypothetical protein
MEKGSRLWIDLPSFKEPTRCSIEQP